MNKPEVKSLPALDLDAAKREGADHVATQLADLAGQERIEAAVKLIDTLAAQAETVRPQRDRAAWTIATQYQVRRGTAIHSALGVGRTRWKAIRDTQNELAPEPMDGALEKLPGLAHQAAMLHHAILAANEARNAAVNDLPPTVRNAEIARLIGRHPARVSHVRHRETLTA